MPNLGSGSASTDLFTNSPCIKQIVKKSLVKDSIVSNLDQSQSLIVEISPTFGDQCGTSKETWALLRHCDNQVVFSQDILFGNVATVEAILARTQPKSAALIEVSGCEDDMCSTICEELSFECKSMLHMDCISEFDFGPGHPGNFLPTGACRSATAPACQ